MSICRILSIVAFSKIPILNPLVILYNLKANIFYIIYLHFIKN